MNVFVRYRSNTISLEPSRDYHLLIVKLPFKVKAPIIIGKGVEPGLNIRETITITIGGKQYFIIPSSSLKGVFRKLSATIAYKMVSKLQPHIGQVIMTHDEDKVKHKIDLEDEDLIEQLYSQNKDVMDRICFSKKNMPCNRLKKEDLETYMELVLSLYCPICSLYGSRHYAGIITFKPVIIPFEERTVDVRYHVAIDRRSRTKEDRALYIDHLLYYVGKVINIEFIVKDLELGSLSSKLLASTLEYISVSGLLVGGGKSIGYGLMEMDRDNVVWSYRRYTSYNEYVSPMTGKGLNTLLDLLRGQST